MDLLKSKIIEIINYSIPSEEIQHSFIYWYKKTISTGEDIGIGSQSIVMPFEGTIVFVDLEPRSNWAHPCRYILVESSTLETKIINASFPPDIDQSDQNYIIILRFGQIPTHERYFNLFD